MLVLISSKISCNVWSQQLRTKLKQELDIFTRWWWISRSWCSWRWIRYTTSSSAWSVQCLNTSYIIRMKSKATWLVSSVVRVHDSISVSIIMFKSQNVTQFVYGYPKVIGTWKKHLPLSRSINKRSKPSWVGEKLKAHAEPSQTWKMKLFCKSF